MSHPPPQAPAPAHVNVFDALTGSRARLWRRADVGDGLALAQWSNDYGAINYRPDHHTLSLYLRGGQDTFRTDAPHERGAPGRFCLMPAEYPVDWVIGSEQRFLHLYFAPCQLGPLALRLLDREPREIHLPELNFAIDADLARRLATLVALDWTDTHDRLAANEVGHAVLAHVLLRYVRRPLKPSYRGGLAPALRRRLIEWLDARLAEPLTVGDMAAFCALSEHHFAHAFRASFDCAPHAWLAARRIERAAQLLRSQPSLPLADVAAATGHSHASHLVRRFRAVKGVSPGQFRSARAQSASSASNQR